MRNVKIKNFLATLILCKLYLQIGSFAVTAQKRTTRTETEELPNVTAGKSKISPDFQEKSDLLFNGFRGDETQRVIIQKQGLYSNDVPVSDGTLFLGSSVMGNESLETVC